MQQVILITILIKSTIIFLICVYLHLTAAAFTANKMACKPPNPVLPQPQARLPNLPFPMNPMIPPPPLIIPPPMNMSPIMPGVRTTLPVRPLNGNKTER